MRHMKRAAGVAVIATVALTMAACSAGGESGGGTDAAACAPSEGEVTLTLTSWIPGIEDAVAIWNDANPDIQVEVQTGPSGNAGTYQNFFNQLEAGNAPDLGQIEYDAIPNFRVQDGLEDLAACEEIVAAEDQFVDWTWGQVTLGTDDEVYGVPQDSGPMALFYRSDLFEQNGIAIPTTWEEYRAAAEQIRALGGYITNFSQSDINQFAGFVWQGGGEWFTNDGEEWTVELTGDTSITVADYWQDLIENDLVAVYPPWTDEWNNAYNSGEVWTWNSAVWGANSIASGAPDTAGKWSVAPISAVGGRRCGRRQLGRIVDRGLQGNRAPLRGRQVRALAEHVGGGAHVAQRDRRDLSRDEGGTGTAGAAGGRRVLRRSEDLRGVRRGGRAGQPRLRLGPDHDADLRRRVGRVQGRDLR